MLTCVIPTSTEGTFIVASECYSKVVSEGACGVLGEDVDEGVVLNIVVDAPLLQEY